MLELTKFLFVFEDNNVEELDDIVKVICGILNSMDV